MDSGEQFVTEMSWVNSYTSAVFSAYTLWLVPCSALHRTHCC